MVCIRDGSSEIYAALRLLFFLLQRDEMQFRNHDVVSVFSEIVYWSNILFLFRLLLVG